MGWEQRHGRWYLYHNHRVDGKPLKEYLGARDGRFGFGKVMLHELLVLRDRQTELRELLHRKRLEYEARIGGLLAGLAAASTQLRTVAEGVLYALGYHKHNRGGWRVRREQEWLTQLIEALKGDARPAPLVSYPAPADDAAAIELFA